MITLLSKQASDVDHIDVVNQNTSFTLRPKEVEETSEEESSVRSPEVRLRIDGTSILKGEDLGASIHRESDPVLPEGMEPS